MNFDGESIFNQTRGIRVQPSLLKLEGKRTDEIFPKRITEY